MMMFLAAVLVGGVCGYFIHDENKWIRVVALNVMFVWGIAVGHLQ